MKHLNVIIVEDEPATARNLAHLLQTIDDTIQIIETLTGVEDAVEWFKENTSGYDLVFMDINLGDGMSFDIFKQAEVQTPVIFVTAYNNHGITAFKNNGIDYILKPFEREDLELALNKFKKFASTPDTATINLQISQLIEQINNPGRLYKRSFLVHYRDKLIPVDAGSISFFYTANEIVYAYTTDDKMYVMDHTIDALMRQLDPDSFFKANRQFIVNRKCITEVDFFFNGRLSLKIKPEPPEKILVSKARVPEFKMWMNS
jgi:DNA-binding LytR/AlgR family response regulator